MPVADPARPAGPVDRRRALLDTGVVVGALVALNVGRHYRAPGGIMLPLAVAAGLLVFARARGLSWSELGLGRDRVGSGLRWAALSVAIVGAGYLVGVLLPLTRPAFLDSRYDLDVRGALLSAFVVIPLGTVVVEEIAFRSVLWGMLARFLSPWRVLAVSSVLFGLWHVLPSLSFAAANEAVADASPGALTTVLVVLGTVAFTAAGGAVAGELRRRSGSVLASAGMHWATNGLGVMFGLAARSLAG